MDWRSRGKEALVGGVTGLAVVTVYIIGRAILANTSDGDWLAFAGAMLGIGMAICGALWVESAKRRVERTAESKAILASAIRLRAIATTMLSERPHDVAEADWQDAINKMPENLATYVVSLERALNRLTTATEDFDIEEAGEMMLRAAKRANSLLVGGHPDQAPQVIAVLDLLRNSCDISIRLLRSRISGRTPVTFAEAIGEQGRRIN